MTAIAERDQPGHPTSRKRTPPGRRTGTVQHYSRAERVAIGKAARAATPLEAHADFSPDRSRPDPVELLVQQGASRVADLVPIRFGRMLDSPFTYYRVLRFR